MRILVTAGPTREYIDDVRFITNASSGRMGYVVAESGVSRGHEVDLITGPVAIEPPPGVGVINVKTALEMRDAVLERTPVTDALVMTAAVSDWRPIERFSGKLQKTNDMKLTLESNPDILRESTERNPGMIAIGFALEVDMDAASANRKMEEKGADLIVLNSVAAIGSEESDFEVFSRGGTKVFSGRYTKAALAEMLIDLLEKGKPI